MLLLRTANVPEKSVIGPVSVGFLKEKKTKEKKSVGPPNELIPRRNNLYTNTLTHTLCLHNSCPRQLGIEILLSQ